MGGEVGMTNEEAIRILNEQRNKFMDEYVDFGGVNEAYNKAIDLLKEQESVKPVQHLVYTTRGWFCGACDGRLNMLGKYCSFCGRPVKWNG